MADGRCFVSVVSYSLLVKDSDTDRMEKVGNAQLISFFQVYLLLQTSPIITIYVYAVVVWKSFVIFLPLGTWSLLWLLQSDSNELKTPPWQESYSHFVVYTKSWLAEQSTPVALEFEDKARKGETMASLEKWW